MEQEVLELELHEIMSALDDKRLSVLVNNLSAAELQQHKTALTEAWYWIYEFWYHERREVKMEKGVDTFFNYLFFLLTEAEKINTPVIYYNERAHCYEMWSRQQTNKEEQLVYLDKAIAEISKGLQADPSSCILNCIMINLYIDRAYLTKQFKFTDEQLTMLFGYFERVLTRFSGEEWSSLLGNCFQILEFTPEGKERWHKVFIDRFTAAIETLTPNDLVAYPKWKRNLHLTTSLYHATMSPDYQQKIVLVFMATLRRLYGKYKLD